MVKLSLIKSVDNLLPKRNSPSIGIKHGPVCPFYADVLFTLCDLLVRHKGLPVGAETRTFNILNQPFQKFPRDGTENVIKMGHIKVNGYTFKGSNSYILPPFSLASTLNPIALRKAKIAYNFGLSGRNRVKRVKGKNCFPGANSFLKSRPHLFWMDFITQKSKQERVGGNAEVNLIL